MSCIWCHRLDGKTNDHQGDCAVRHEQVCTAPPLRADQKFHGDWCRCCRDRDGSLTLVCVFDAEEHAWDRHQRPPMDCLPGLAQWLALDAVDGAARALRQGPDDSSATQIGLFLTTTFPGGRALVTMERLWRPEAMGLAPLGRDDDLVEFSLEHLGAGFIQKTLVLAKNALRQTWRNLERQEIRTPRLMDDRLPRLGNRPRYLYKLLQLDLLRVHVPLAFMRSPGDPIHAAHWLLSSEDEPEASSGGGSPRIPAGV